VFVTKGTTTHRMNVVLALVPIVTSSELITDQCVLDGPTS